MQQTTISSLGQPVTASADAELTTRNLLTVGMLAGPLFMGLALLQVLTRQGFDLRRDAISLLTLGDLGWVQVTNFIASGLLAVALAVGVRRALHPGRGATWGPLLIGLFGAGLVTGGLFTPDPSFGFPPGAPEGMPTSMSPHAIVHSIGFFVAFLSIIPACFVLMRRFAEQKERLLASYSAVTGVAAPILIVLGSSNPEIGGVIFFIDGVVVCTWLLVIGLRLRQATATAIR